MSDIKERRPGLSKTVAAIIACGALVLTGLFMKRNPRSQPPKAETARSGAAVISGTLTVNGEKVNSGALIMASLAPIPDPPPTIRASKPPKPPIFSGSAGADGTYSIEVDPSANPYHLRVFYPVMDDVGKVVTYSKAASGILVDKQGGQVEQNFSWP